MVRPGQETSRSRFPRLHQAQGTRGGLPPRDRAEPAVPAELGKQGTCEAISLRRHYPDQVMGVAFLASQPSVRPSLGLAPPAKDHEFSSLVVSQVHSYLPPARPRIAGPKVPGTRAFGPMGRRCRRA
jgi:hypothetical protein